MPRTVTSFETDDTGLAAVRRPVDQFWLEEMVAPDVYDCAEGSFRTYRRVVEVTDLGEGRHRVDQVIDWSLAIPVWEPLFRPLLRSRLTATFSAPPGSGSGQLPWWAPPDRLDIRATMVLSQLCVLSLLAGYLGTVITQTITYAADQFGASSTAQGSTLAAVRVGIVLALVLAVMADRYGRKRLLVLTSVGGAVATAMGALSYDMVSLGVTQTFSRAFSTALALLIAIVAAEEMPAGARAYAASVLAMTGALGAGGAVLLLPLADLGVDGWRLVYLAPLIGLPFFWVIGRRIPESRRFVRRTAASAKATLSGHRGRLAMLAASSFFALLFLAPNSQFQNDFLRNEHGFTALQLTLFTVLTNTPAGIGVVVGGRLADTRGRRRVGAIGTIGGAILLAAAYQVGGVWLWAFTVTGSIVAAVTVPALAVYGPELFPTSLRARANGVISLAGVLGSSAGLLIAGRMEDHLGRYGPGIALLAIGPLIVAALVLAFYPETAHLELEELNPEDEIPNPLSFPVL